MLSEILNQVFEWILEWGNVKTSITIRTSITWKLNFNFEIHSFKKNTRWFETPPKLNLIFETFYQLVMNLYKIVEGGFMNLLWVVSFMNSWLNLSNL
jgi:hypothetical protein